VLAALLGAVTVQPAAAYEDEDNLEYLEMASDDEDLIDENLLQLDETKSTV